MLCLFVLFCFNQVIFYHDVLKSNFTSGLVQHRARRETGDSRAVTSTGSRTLVSRFLYASVVEEENYVELLNTQNKTTEE